MTLNKVTYVFVALAMVLSVVSCKKKQQDTDDIVVDKIVEKPQDGPISVESNEQTGTVKWVLDKNYTYIITRAADSSRVVNNNGKEYKDNNITLEVKREDGSDFFKKTFKKDNFSNVLPSEIQKNGVLLSMRLESVQGNNMNFVVSVGSPDETNEEFYYVRMTLNNMAQTSASEYHGAMEAEE